VLELLSDYEVIVLGDREFGSVKLASWLCERQVKFILVVLLCKGWRIITLDPVF
jgi:hypothetical protein